MRQVTLYGGYRAYRVGTDKEYYVMHDDSRYDIKRLAPMISGFMPATKENIHTFLRLFFDKTYEMEESDEYAD